jgi:putative addiction module CopG family antidote
VVLLEAPMSTDLPPDLELFVQQKVASGVFQSAQQAIVAAVQQMRDREARLAAFVAPGLEDLAHGRFTEFDAAGLRDYLERISPLDDAGE